MTLVLREMDDTGIVTLTLNDPETRNAISDAPMIAALLEALAAAEADPAARVIILTGAGRAFSSGGNIKTMGEAGGLNDALAARTRLNYRHGIQRIPLAMEALELRKHPPRAVWLFSGLSVYRVSLWTHTKTPAVFKFYRFLIPAAVAVGRMMRRYGSLKKAIATA